MAISSQNADKFRLKHAEELLALFEGAPGRPARTTDELAQWLDSVDDDLADDIAREVAEEAGCFLSRAHLCARRRTFCNGAEGQPRSTGHH